MLSHASELRSTRVQRWSLRAWRRAQIGGCAGVRTEPRTIRCPEGGRNTPNIVREKSQSVYTRYWARGPIYHRHWSIGSPSRTIAWGRRVPGSNRIYIIYVDILEAMARGKKTVVAPVKPVCHPPWCGGRTCIASTHDSDTAYPCKTSHNQYRVRHHAACYAIVRRSSARVRTSTRVQHHARAQLTPARPAAR